MDPCWVHRISEISLSQASTKPTHPNSFFRFIVIVKNQLPNKPNLHIKGANLLKNEDYSVKMYWDLLGTYAFLATFSNTVRT